MPGVTRQGVRDPAGPVAQRWAGSEPAVSRAAA
jgi:hypothetical protein